MCSLQREPILLFFGQVDGALKILRCQSEFTFMEMGRTPREVYRSASQIVFFERQRLLIKGNCLGPGGQTGSELTCAKRVRSYTSRKISICKVMRDQACDGVRIILIN